MATRIRDESQIFFCTSRRFRLHYLCDRREREIFVERSEKFLLHTYIAVQQTILNLDKCASIWIFSLSLSFFATQTVRSKFSRYVFAFAFAWLALQSIKTNWICCVACTQCVCNFTTRTITHHTLKHIRMDGSVVNRKRHSHTHTLEVKLFRRLCDRLKPEAPS